MDDRHVVALFLRRAETAIDVLAARYGKRLHRMALNILGDREDAEECVNDTYLAVWNTIPPNEPEPLSAYVLRIGRNTALKRLRGNMAQKRNSTYDLSLEELSGCIGGGDLNEALDARALGQAIDTFLDTLPKENRILFVRRYWFGDSVRSIAQATGLTENTVSVRLNRTRGKLKDYLTQEGFL